MIICSKEQMNKNIVKEVVFGTGSNQNDWITIEPKFILTSIGGSPIHEGHTRILRDCKRIVTKRLIKSSMLNEYKSIYKNLKLIVVVNSNEWLKNKHGFCFQDENSRAEIIDAIKDVDFVYVYHSKDKDISGAIHEFQPDFFCKGGDRSNINKLPIQEVEACQKCNTSLIFGVGGTDKVSSSSELIKRAVEHYSYEAFHELWERN